jgi:hypothetical protein
MLMHATVVKVQIEGFAILANLVSSKPNRTTLISLDCMVLVRNGMKLHPKRSDVQIEIFAFLANLGFHGTATQTDR